MSKRTFVIIAHRGQSNQAPENTVAAFDLAIRQGFKHVEADCQLTRDKVCVILHDERLGRTNNGTGLVKDADWETLKMLDAGSWFSPSFINCRIPTLHAMLEQFRDKVHIHLELKSEQEDLPKVAASILNRYPEWLASVETHSTPSTVFPVPGLTVTSFHSQQLARSLQELPRVRHGWLVQELTDEVFSTAKSLGIDQLCPRANACTEFMVSRALERGFSLRAWSIKNLELLEQTVKLGIHGGTVDWPDKAEEHLCSDN